MKLTWLGHSGFRLEIGNQILLLDPWVSGNPSFPEARRAEAIDGATAILLSHGHGDHASNTIAIANECDIPILCIHELSEWLTAEGVNNIGFGKGGTVTLGDVKVTMVHAVHSSSIDFQGGRPTYAGGEAGFVIRGEGRSVYFSGDTDVFMDMELIADRYKPDVGILCAGGHYTMDMEGVAYACKRFFNFKTIIPCHYKTFPLLAQSAQELVEALPEHTVLEPEVMKPVTL